MNQHLDIRYVATVRCPRCGEQTEAEMADDACQFFWECLSVMR